MLIDRQCKIYKKQYTMPLNKKDRKIKTEMSRRYGQEKAERVFYASATAGKLGKDVQRRHGAKKATK